MVVSLLLSTDIVLIAISDVQPYGVLQDISIFGPSTLYKTR